MKTPSLLHRLARDRRGLSAIEFALLAPVLILLLFGLAEFCQGYMAQRRVSHTASSVADMIARANSVTESDVNAIFAVGGLVMNPFPAGGLSQRAASVVLDNKGVAKVEWVIGSIPGRPLAKGDVVALPDDLVTGAGKGVIVAEAHYVYRSPVGYVLKDDVTFDHTFRLLPRNVDKVVLTP